MAKINQSGLTFRHGLSIVCPIRSQVQTTETRASDVQTQGLGYTMHNPETGITKSLCQKPKTMAS